MTMSTVILNQQFSPALCRSECSVPKRGRRELFFTEGSRQLGNGQPRGLMSFFNFGAALWGVGGLIYQVRNHHRRCFIARQARLANYQQRVIGFRKIGVVAHRSLCCGLRTTILARITGFHRISRPRMYRRDLDLPRLPSFVEKVVSARYGLPNMMLEDADHPARCRYSFVEEIRGNSLTRIPQVQKLRSSF